MAPTNDIIQSFDLTRLMTEPASVGVPLKPHLLKEPGEKFYATTIAVQYLAGVEDAVPNNKFFTQTLTSNYFSGINNSIYMMETDQYKQNTRDLSTIVAKAPEPVYRATTSKPQEVKMSYCCNK